MGNNLEIGGVEIAQAIQKFNECDHELYSIIRERMTFDARKQVVKETRCKKCGLYYTIEIQLYVKEEQLAKNGFQISDEAMRKFLGKRES